MKLHIIFGQRKCNYPGEYAPEALDIADEYTMDVNPEFLEIKLLEHRKDESFQSVQVLIVKVADQAIDNLLMPKTPEVVGEVLK
jgi:hypothetical protein